MIIFTVVDLLCVVITLGSYNMFLLFKLSYTSNAYILHTVEVGLHRLVCLYSNIQNVYYLLKIDML